VDGGENILKQTQLESIQRLAVVHCCRHFSITADHIRLTNRRFSVSDDRSVIVRATAYQLKSPKLSKLYPVYTMKETWSKLPAHVAHVYFEYVCSMFASSCKRGISDLLWSVVFSNADKKCVHAQTTCWMRCFCRKETHIRVAAYVRINAHVAYNIYVSRDSEHCTSNTTTKRWWCQGKACSLCSRSRVQRSSSVLGCFSLREVTNCEIRLLALASERNEP